METNGPKPAVFITGCSSGIGHAAALALGRRGFQVLATVRRQADADQLAAVLPGVTPLLLDITDGPAIAQTAARVAEQVGEAGLAGLVNNAGSGVGGPLEFVPLNEVRQLFEVLLFGHMAVTQALLPLLRKGQGRIVNISSTASLSTLPFHGPYSMAKRAMTAYSEGLRRELRPQGVPVCNLIVGSMRTPIWQRGAQEADRMSRLMPPEWAPLYAARWQAMGAYFQRMGEQGGPPELAARAIVRALTARRPRTTYYVGADAVFFLIFASLLKGRALDWAVRALSGVE